MARKSRKETEIVEAKSVFEKLYKVGLYARLSVEDIRKKESDSIGTQTSLLRQYVNEQTDMMEVSLYQDIDKTGTNFNRPGFNKLLDDIRAKKINCIVVKDLSRFGRNHIETGNYLERVFPFMGVRFVAIGDGYDSNAPTSGDELIVPLKNLMNEITAKDISKKVRSEYAMKRQRGEFCGAFAPYGYIKEGNTLVMDAQAAEVVKRIFQLVLEGHSDNSIAATLNELKILPPNRHRYEQGLLQGEKHSKCQYWYKSVVKRITENPAYLGQLEQGKYRTALMNGGVRIYTPKSDWVISKDTHTAIVDEATFEAVQELRRNRTARYNQQSTEANRPKSSENILKGFIFCGDCLRNLSRKKIVRASGKVDYRYLCPTYEEVDKCKCTKKRLLESELLPLIHSFIDVQIQTLTDINRLIEDVRAQTNYVNKMEAANDSMARAQKDMARLTEIRSSLYEDYESGLLSKDDYLLMKKKYETRHKELSDHITTLANQKSKQTNIASQNKWAATFSSFQKGKSLNRELVESVIERIDVSETNDVAITVKYRDEQLALLKELSDYTSEGVAV